MNRHGWTTLLLTSVLVASVAACSDDDDTPPPSGPTGATTTPATSAASSTVPTGTPTSRPSAAVTTRPATPGVVTVTMRPIGCRDCRITAFTTVDGVTRSLGTRIAEQGFPSWTVPAARTKGMAFTLVDLPGIGTRGATTAVVMQYQGIAPGTVVTDQAAAERSRATYCWAGTNRSTTITVQVARFTDTDASGQETESLRAFASPMRTGLGSFVAADDGALAVTDVPRCPAA